MLPKRKFILFSAAGIALLFLGLTLTIYALVDLPLIKQQVTSSVKKATGLDLKLEGSISWHVFPWLGVEFDNASLDGMEGFENAPFLHVDKVGLELEILPLLNKKFKLKNIRVRGLDATIIRNKQGRFNFQAIPIQKIQVKKEQVTVQTKKNTSVTFSYMVESLRVDKSKLLFKDQLSGRSYEVNDIDFLAQSDKKGPSTTGISLMTSRLAFTTTLDDPALTGNIELLATVSARPESLLFTFKDTQLLASATPLPGAKKLPFTAANTKLTGTLEIDGKHGIFTASNIKTISTLAAERFTAPIKSTGSAQRIMFNASSGTLETEKLSFKALDSELHAQAQGSNLLSTPSLKVAVATKDCNVRKLLQHLGIQFPSTNDEKTYERVALTADFALEPNLLQLNMTKLVLDDSTLSGMCTMRDFKQPEWDASLYVDTLNLDRYLPQRKTKTAPKTNKKDAASATKNTTAQDSIPQWVRTLRGKVSVRARALTVKNIALQNVKTMIVGKNGIYKVAPLRAEAYKGTLDATAEADFHDKIPAYALNAECKNIRVRPLLKALQGKPRLSGTGTCKLRVTAQGLSEKSLKRSLAGTGAASLRSGEIYGLRLSPEYFLSNNALSKAAKQGASTPYKVISMSTTLKKGVAYSKDLRAQTATAKVKGRGEVDVLTEELKLHLKLNMLNVASIPMDITGTINKPRVHLDPDAVAKEVTKGAKQLLNIFESVLKNVNK